LGFLHVVVAAVAVAAACGLCSVVVDVVVLMCNRKVVLVILWVLSDAALRLPSVDSLFEFSNRTNPRHAEFSEGSRTLSKTTPWSSFHRSANASSSFGVLFIRES
jgi:hypothetical protein